MLSKDLIYDALFHQAFAGNGHFRFSGSRFTFAAGGLQFIENASDASIMGLEFDLQALLTDNFEIVGSLGILDSEYRNFSCTNGGVTEDLSGNRLTGAPNSQFNLYGRCTIPSSIGDFVSHLWSKPTSS